MEVLSSAVAWTPLHSVWDPFCPLKSLPHVLLFVVFLHLHLPHVALNQRRGEPPPLGGQNTVNLYSTCSFPIPVFSISLQDQRFLPKNSIADVSWCSLITFKLISKQHNKNAVPSNTLSNSLAVLEREK